VGGPSRHAETAVDPRCSGQPPGNANAAAPEIVRPADFEPGDADTTQNPEQTRTHAPEKRGFIGFG